jgi:hypothetical protein
LVWGFQLQPISPPASSDEDFGQQNGVAPALVMQSTGSLPAGGL